MSDKFSEADHDRARRAGQQAMAKLKPPRERKQHQGWRFLFGWLALTQLAAFIVAVVNMFHGVNLNRAFVGYLISWPVVLSPRWLGLVAAVGALIVMIRIWQHLGGGQPDTGS